MLLHPARDRDSDSRGRLLLALEKPLMGVSRIQPAALLAYRLRRNDQRLT